MRKMLSLVLLTISVTSALFFSPAMAEAHTRLVCKRVWHRGHLVRRCRPVAPPHHYRRQPQHRRPNYV